MVHRLTLSSSVGASIAGPASLVHSFFSFYTHFKCALWQKVWSHQSTHMHSFRPTWLVAQWSERLPWMQETRVQIPANLTFQGECWWVSLMVHRLTLSSSVGDSIAGPASLVHSFQHWPYIVWPVFSILHCLGEEEKIRHFEVVQYAY